MGWVEGTLSLFIAGRSDQTALKGPFQLQRLYSSMILSHPGSSQTPPHLTSLPNTSMFYPNVPSWCWGFELHTIMKKCESVDQFIQQHEVITKYLFDSLQILFSEMPWHASCRGIGTDGMERQNGMEWNGMERNGTERNAQPFCLPYYWWLFQLSNVFKNEAIKSYVFCLHNMSHNHTKHKSSSGVGSGPLHCAHSFMWVT